MKSTTCICDSSGKILSQNTPGNKSDFTIIPTHLQDLFLSSNPKDLQNMLKQASGSGTPQQAWLLWKEARNESPENSPALYCQLYIEPNPGQKNSDLQVTIKLYESHEILQTLNQAPLPAETPIRKTSRFFAGEISESVNMLKKAIDNHGNRPEITTELVSHLDELCQSFAKSLD